MPHRQAHTTFRLSSAATSQKHAVSMHYRGRLREQGAQVRCEVKNGFVPRIPDEVFPTLKALQTAQCPFKNLPEKEA